MSSGKDELRKKLCRTVGWQYKNGWAFEKTGERLNITEKLWSLENLIAASNHQARLQAANDIFNLAHEYAQEDKTMHGAEELRAYHYFNAICKIGEFDGR